MTIDVGRARTLASSGVARTLVGIPRNVVLGAIGAGVILGIAYTLSPLSIWFAAGALWLLLSAAKGLGDRERRYVLVVLTAALLTRLMLVLVLFAISPHDSQGAVMLFGDEAYAQRRALRLRLIWAHMPGSPWDYINAFDEYGWSGFLYPLAYVQLLFGPAPFAMRLVNAALFAGGAVVLFRLVRRAYGFVPAIIGMTILLFLPSLFVWSISLMKESLYFLITAASLATSVASLRAPSWRSRVRPMALCAGLLVGTGLLRPGGLVLTAGGIAIGLVLWLSTRRVRTAIVALAAALVLCTAAAQSERAQNWVLGQIQVSARAHGGHVFTIGHSYKLLDPDFYTAPTFYTWTMTPAQASRYVVRAFVSFVTVPTPWQIESRAELAYLPEQMVWYALVLLAPIGIVAGFRRDSLVTSMLVGYMLAAAAGVALTSGNVGTLIRHRALITPNLVWLSALGITIVISWLSSNGKDQRLQA